MTMAATSTAAAARSSEDPHGGGGGGGGGERAQRLLKGLAEAKARVDAVVVEDSKYPDLFDQLATQSEPQNYFFEPYASQWCPQVIPKGNVLPLPSVIATSLEEELRSLTLAGLLPPLGHAWTSVDHRLFLWSYRQRGRFVVYEFDQPIVAVGLCVGPRAGVFTDKVQHLLVVATTVEVVLVAVLYEDHKTLASGLRLQRTKLSVSTDNTVVRRIVTTAPHGRIFFGGSDGGVYELLYGPSGGGSGGSGGGSGFGGGGGELDASLFIPSFFQRRGCRKVTHTSQLANYLPSFLSALAASPGKVLEFAADEERQILYVLHEHGDVDVFDLGVHGHAMSLICTLNLLTAGAKYARDHRRTRVSCPDERLFQQPNLQIVSLAVVGRHESVLVNLVAVASNGLRFFLSVYSRATYTVGNAIPVTKRPTRLEIVSIRLPPPAVTIADAPPYHAKEGMQPGYAPGKSPSHVHLAYHKQGVLLLVDGGKDEQDRLIGITHDPITSSLAAAPSIRGKPTLREAVTTESCIGKIVDIQELDEAADLSVAARAAARGPVTNTPGAKRSFEEMSTGASGGTGNSSSVLSNDVVPMVGEMAQQYSAPSRHFLCLSSAGIQVFKKIRPIDQLHRLLLVTRGSDLKATLAPFIRSFGEIQVCCMLIALACGVQSDPLTTEGTTAAAAAASASIVHRAGVKSDEYIFTTAMQGIFECGQIARAADLDTSGANGNAAPTQTRIVLTTEFGMSYQHDGLVMFMTRVLRPLWFDKTIGRRVVTGKGPSSTVTHMLAHSKEKLDEIREVLFQLRQLMESAGPYAVSISSGAVLENTMDWNDADASSRVAELAGRYHKQRNEDQLKREMRFKAEQRSLYFLYQLVLRSIEAISLLRFTIDFELPLEESLARLSFGDFVSTAEGTTAAKAMIKALLKGRNENNQFLVKQLREQCPSFFSVSDLWHYQGYKSLAMAKLSAPGAARKPHLQESLTQFLNACHMWDTEDAVDVLQGICEDYALLHFYEGVVKLVLACARNFHDAAATDLTGVKWTWKRNCFGCILLVLRRLLAGDSKKSGQTPQGVDDMVRLDDETRRKYVDEVLHYALASEDREFHDLLYAWLYDNGHTHILTSVRSPFIEDFLKERDQDLLIKMYMEQHKYLVAAKVWWSRAHEDCEDLALENNPDIVKRQYYVSKALGCLKSIEDVSEAADAIREVRDVLDVLQLQVRVLKSLEQATIELEAAGGAEAEVRARKDDIRLLTFKIFDASSLYNQFASKYDMWSECLQIIHACDSEEPDVIELLWRKIIFDIVPPSSASTEFNAWRADECELAGLAASPTVSPSFPSASFESGYWIGQLQSKILRLGKSLYADGAERHASASMSALSGVVFPVGFLAKHLERVSLWFQRLTQVPSFSAWSTSSGTSFDPATFNWVLKLFIDVGVPHRVLLSHYERIYREQGQLEWTLHLLQSIHAILSLWRRHAISPRAAKDELADYSACCPHLVAICDDIVTELQAIPTDDRREIAVLLEQFRRYKSELMSHRVPM